ncbi:pimeloyl-ACP methyl ester carboxylesterase [Microbacterium sp. AK009]|uniref:epoxide hydrolase family protein n=1 Tax=Microbacterium sp. AK009 TaxID=2723068 RepID=UPI0015C7DD6C|nr:epoxide hydrolase family protein [Microbacterium sp. AK009]NYF16650.1 pimeloyl-ACP methyl ester carboxylesterase [Microbacterium sp. AK009]
MKPPLHVPESVLHDLRGRLDSTRWPDAVVDDWSWGTPVSPLEALVDRWRNGYDWRATEERINAYDHGHERIDGLNVHFIRAGTRGATPLLLLHGWPDSPLRFEKSIPLLAERFELVIPSIPGYGFSDRPPHPGYGPGQIADLLAALMARIDLPSFGVHGGDIGSAIAEEIALRHPEHVVGLHLVDVPYWHRYAFDASTATPDEQAFLDAMTAWSVSEGAYAALHRTKPQTLAYALEDSPVGLAAWFLEKFHAWSDCAGDVWTVFSPDELIDNAMVYWVTRTAGSAIRYYRDAALHPGDPARRVTVPTGFTIFPKDIAHPPRSYAERFFTVAHWTTMPRGGHFGAWEDPAGFARDVTVFFDAIT